MQKMRRFLAAILVAMTVLSCNVTGFAATKPSAKLVYQSAKSVKRGKTVKLNYYLNCGSYKKKSGKYRAFFLADAYYKTVASGNLTHYWDYLFTGKGYYYTAWKVSKKVKTGKYVIAYGCLYSKTGSSGTITASQNWKGTYKTTTLKVK